MTLLTFPKSSLGPIIEVSAEPSESGKRELAAAGRRDDVQASLRMLIDTGSDETILDEELIDPWGLAYVGAVFVNTINGLKPARRYEISLTLHGEITGITWTSQPMIVVARRSPFEGRPYKGLLGRDVLDQSTFVCDGRTHRCSLEF